MPPRKSTLSKATLLSTEIASKISGCRALHSSNRSDEAASLVDDILKMSESQSDAERVETIEKLLPWASSDQLRRTKRFYVTGDGGSKKMDDSMSELTRTLLDDAKKPGWTDFWITSRKSRLESWCRGRYGPRVGDEGAESLYREASLQGWTLFKCLKEKQADQMAAPPKGSASAMSGVKVQATDEGMRAAGPFQGLDDLAAAAFTASETKAAEDKAADDKKHNRMW